MSGWRLLAEVGGGGGRSDNFRVRAGSRVAERRAATSTAPGPASRLPSRRFRSIEEWRRIGGGVGEGWRRGEEGVGEGMAEGWEGVAEVWRVLLTPQPPPSRSV